MVIDLDATLVTAHSEKEQASRTWNKTLGFHPLLAYVDHGVRDGGEPVGELLRPGNAGSNTATDHVVVLDAALAQLPERLRRADQQGRVAVLVRTEAAGATHTFATHLAARGVDFSLGANLGHFDIHTALALLPAAVWTPAYQARQPRTAEQGIQIEPRDGAWVAEITPEAGEHRSRREDQTNTADAAHQPSMPDDVFTSMRQSRRTYPTSSAHSAGGPRGRMNLITPGAA